MSKKSSGEGIPSLRNRSELYRPEPGDLKSGMPAATEMPAPASTNTLRARRRHDTRSSGVQRFDTSCRPSVASLGGVVGSALLVLFLADDDMDEEEEEEAVFRPPARAAALLGGCFGAFMSCPWLQSANEEEVVPLFLLGILRITVVSCVMCQYV